MKHKLFEKKFVYCMWDDELEGKKCIVADSTTELMVNVNEGYESCQHIVMENCCSSYPFVTEDGADRYLFVYYDPLYEYKKAWIEGKTVQVWNTTCNIWVDVESNLLWSEHAEEATFRIKPEEEKEKLVELPKSYLMDSGAMFVVQSPIMFLWQSTVCEIRAEIKSYENTADEDKRHALYLCNRLEESMCAACGGSYPLQYDITEDGVKVGD